MRNAVACRWWPVAAVLAMLALGWAVGRGSTPVDAWFARSVGNVVGVAPRWMLVFTSFWLAVVLTVACAAVTGYRRQWRLMAAVVLCPIVAIAVNAGLKRLFDRRNGAYVEYPSGHTTLLVTVVALLVVVVGARRWMLAVAATVVVLGALGLVACGYHYLTDTVGSVLLGGALAATAVRLAARSPAGAVRRHRRAAGSALVCVAGLAASTVLAASPTAAAPEPDPPPAVPPLSAAAYRAGFVDIRSAVPDAVIDLRYATPNNFVGTQLYPADARCLVHESLIAGLATAAGVLRGQGRALVFWDCYRPHRVQAAMFDIVPDPMWVARPGRFARSHVAGRSVDVTVTDPAARCAPPVAAAACLAEMGTDFDDFSPRAGAFTTAGVSAAAVANRAVLRNAMSEGGFQPYSSEWWHFDGPGAGVDRPIPDVAIN